MSILESVDIIRTCLFRLRLSVLIVEIRDEDVIFLPPSFSCSLLGLFSVHLLLLSSQHILGLPSSHCGTMELIERRQSRASAFWCIWRREEHILRYIVYKHFWFNEQNRGKSKTHFRVFHAILFTLNRLLILR